MPESLKSGTNTAPEQRCAAAAGGRRRQWQPSGSGGRGAIGTCTACGFTYYRRREQRALERQDRGRVSSAKPRAAVPGLQNSHKFTPDVKYQVSLCVLTGAVGGRRPLPLSGAAPRAPSMHAPLALAPVLLSSYSYKLTMFVGVSMRVAFIRGAAASSCNCFGRLLGDQSAAKSNVQFEQCPAIHSLIQQAEAGRLVAGFGRVVLAVPALCTAAVPAPALELPCPRSSAHSCSSSPLSPASWASGSSGSLSSLHSRRWEVDEQRIGM